MTRFQGQPSRKFKKPLTYTAESVQPLFAFAEDNQAAFDFQSPSPPAAKSSPRKAKDYCFARCRRCGATFSVLVELFGTQKKCVICQAIKKAEGKV